MYIILQITLFMCIVRYSVKMWGRASMAAVMILILTYLCTFNIAYAKGIVFSYY